MLCNNAVLNMKKISWVTQILHYTEDVARIINFEIATKWAPPPKYYAKLNASQLFPYFIRATSRNLSSHLPVSFENWSPVYNIRTRTSSGKKMCKSFSSRRGIFTFAVHVQTRWKHGDKFDFTCGKSDVQVEENRASLSRSVFSRRAAVKVDKFITGAEAWKMTRRFRVSRTRNILITLQLITLRVGESN